MKIPRFDIKALHGRIRKNQKEERKNRKLRILALAMRARARGTKTADDTKIPRPFLVLKTNPDEVWSLDMMQDEIILPLYDQFPDTFSGWDFEDEEGRLLPDSWLMEYPHGIDDHPGQLIAAMSIVPGREFDPAGDGHWDFTNKQDLNDALGVLMSSHYHYSPMSITSSSQGNLIHSARIEYRVPPP